MAEWDFEGWGTRTNLKCSDGRTIMENAFIGNDGQTVPLVWGHQHNDPNNVLGHALLKNTKGGVRVRGKFNNTDSGNTAKALVYNGDVTALSIYANDLKQNGGNVIHGNIREVSLVLAGANPGAFIDNVNMAHSAYEDYDDGEAYIYTGESLELKHSDEKEGTKEDEPGMEDKEKKSEGKTVKDVFDTLTEEQKNVVYGLIGAAVGEKEKSDDNRKEDDKEMKHNVFDTEENTKDVLMHDTMNTIIADAKRCGTMKESFLQHADEFGITNIEYLFPDFKNLDNVPQFIKRPTEWVAVVMGAVHHTPFSRIRSLFADITEDEARAKGYIKGNLKKEEVFSLLKRETTPTTIYKKQKFHRDDIVDITTMDVVAWVKTEMRMMLDEEIARAILVGDGRLNSSDDKINPLNIRPIWTDEDLFTIKYGVTLAANATDDAKAKAIIRAAVKSRKDYRGSGNPVLFTTDDLLTDMLLLEDSTGRIIYDSEAKLATAMRVSKIVTVPVMENLTRTDDSNKTRTLAGIIVNLTDYNVGADKGGAVNMFDDFDIDYNGQKYLIETRCSGALTKPFSAIALETIAAS